MSGFLDTINCGLSQGGSSKMTNFRQALITLVLLGEAHAVSHNPTGILRDFSECYISVYDYGNWDGQLAIDIPLNYFRLVGPTYKIQIAAANLVHVSNWIFRRQCCLVIYIIGASKLDAWEVSDFTRWVWSNMDYMSYSKNSYFINWYDSETRNSNGQEAGVRRQGDGDTPVYRLNPINDLQIQVTFKIMAPCLAELQLTVNRTSFTSYRTLLDLIFRAYIESSCEIAWSTMHNDLQPSPLIFTGRERPPWPPPPPTQRPAWPGFSPPTPPRPTRIPFGRVWPPPPDVYLPNVILEATLPIYNQTRSRLEEIGSLNYFSPKKELTQIVALHAELALNALTNYYGMDAYIFVTDYTSYNFLTCQTVPAYISLAAFSEPFQYQVWMAIVVTFFVFVLTFAPLRHVFREHPFVAMLNMIFDQPVRMRMTTSRSGLARGALLLIIFMTNILSQSYRGTLVSDLSVPLPTDRIKFIEEGLALGFKILTNLG